jgi:hypothetical protein
MAVLVTAIHVFAPRQDVDARDKPARDGATHVDRDTQSSELHRSRPHGMSANAQLAWKTLQARDPD